MVALVILASIAAGTVGLIRESLNALNVAERLDHEVAEAGAFLAVVALWPREDLDQRLGERVQGRWRLYISRDVPGLYALTLSDSATGRVLLHTAVLRQDALADR